MSRSERDEDAAATDGSTPLLVVAFGGALTVATGLSITVLAFVLANTVVDGNRVIAGVSLAGILAGFGIYYVGMSELLGSRMP